MGSKGSIEKIAELAETVVAPFGLQLVDVRFVQAGRQRSLEVTIFRPHGQVAFSDCETVSRQLEEALDRQEPPLIEGAFLLEVQSPGIDRQLSTPREFKIFAGHPVEIKTKEKIANLGVSFYGILLDCANGQVTIGNPYVQAEKSKKRSHSKDQAGAEPSGLEKIDLEMSKIIRIKLYPDALAASKSLQAASGQ